MKWTTKPCFEGDQCWCRILVSPDGEEACDDGDIDKVTAQYIVDALNRTGDATNRLERYPLPWRLSFVDRYPDCPFLVADGWDEAKNLRSISCPKSISVENCRLIVDAVNSFYGDGGRS